MIICFKDFGDGWGLGKDYALRDRFGLDSLCFETHIASLGWFCPNSLCFETHFDSSGLVLSRFYLFQDTFFLFGTGSVSIPTVSRHILTLWSWFCPDSYCFETHFDSLELILSRFLLFRDTF